MSLSCNSCPCDTCLYWWSQRCPYGGCYDNYRAKYDPYNVHHMTDPPRKAWSDWDLPGEQRFWCRGGVFFPADPDDCEHYIKYEGQRVESCLKANVSIFQDGYIDCSLIRNFGCERCYEEWCRQHED